MSGLNGDKAWGDIGDQFITRNNNLPVDESTYNDMIKDFWDNRIDINFVRAFHSEWQKFIKDNEDRIEGKYIPKYSLSDEVKTAQDKIAVKDLLRNVLDVNGAMSYSTYILDGSVPSKANYQMLKDGLSLISELYSEFKQSVSSNIIPNLNVQTLEDELEQLSKAQERTQKRINEINYKIYELEEILYQNDREGKDNSFSRLSLQTYNEELAPLYKTLESAQKRIDEINAQLSILEEK